MSKVQVLCVDDELEILKMYKELFSTLGINMISAENGTEAISAMVSNDIKLCFTDINLPDMSGVDIAKKIREIRNDVVIYSISGQGNDKLHNVDKKLFDGNFIKPTKLMDIVVVVKKVLGLK